MQFVKIITVDKYLSNSKYTSKCHNISLNSYNNTKCYNDKNIFEFNNKEIDDIFFDMYYDILE